MTHSKGTLPCWNWKEASCPRATNRQEEVRFFLVVDFSPTRGEESRNKPQKNSCENFLHQGKKVEWVRRRVKRGVGKRKRAKSLKTRAVVLFLFLLFFRRKSNRTDGARKTAGAQKRNIIILEWEINRVFESVCVYLCACEIWCSRKVVPDPAKKKHQPATEDS